MYILSISHQTSLLFTFFYVILSILNFPVLLLIQNMKMISFLFKSQLHGTHALHQFFIVDMQTTFDMQ